MAERSKQVLLCFFLLIVLGFAASVLAQENTPAEPAAIPELPDISPEQIDAFIKDLEDPAAREQLIQQLTTLAQIKSANTQENEVQDATAHLLQAVSERIEILKSDIKQLFDRINTLPQTINWLRQQFADAETRRVWANTLLNLVLVLGAGYLAYYLLYFLLWHPRRVLARQMPESKAVSGLLLFVVLLLNVLPIGAFAVAAYVTLGFVDPIQSIHLTALAWINAAIITRLIVATARLVVAPKMPRLRLLPLDESMAHYLIRWTRHFAFTWVYGYFALQAALLLGLPITGYKGALYLLGLLVTILALVFIWQNRTRIAQVIRGRQDTEVKFQGFRNRLAQFWFLLAALYVLMLYGVWVLEVDEGFFFLLRATLTTLLILVLDHFLWRLAQKAFTRGFRIPLLESYFPGLQIRFNGYIPILRWGVRWLIVGLVGVAIMQAWGIGAFAWLTSEPGRVLGATAATILSIVIISFIIWELPGALIVGYLANTEQDGQQHVQSSRVRTLLALARNALLVVLAVLSTLLILAELGVNIAPLLAGAGVLGCGGGFWFPKVGPGCYYGGFHSVRGSDCCRRCG
jgi:small conductance mechanosensitive channel